MFLPLRLYIKCEKLATIPSIIVFMNIFIVVKVHIFFTAGLLIRLLVFIIL